MSKTTRTEPSVSVSHDSAPSDVLIAGFSAFGLAGVTAVDHLVDDLNLGVGSEPLTSLAAEVRKHQEGFAEPMEGREPERVVPPDVRVSGRPTERRRSIVRKGLTSRRIRL